MTVSLLLCSSGSNAPGKSTAIEGFRASSKSPSRVLDGDERVAGREEEKSISPKRAHPFACRAIFYVSGLLNI